MKNEKIVITLPETNTVTGKKQRHTIVIEPGDPATRCTIYRDTEPFNVYSHGWIEAVGIGARKHGDAYNLETGCLMSLKSACRRISDREVRTALWKAYFDRFPLKKQQRIEEKHIEMFFFRSLAHAIEKSFESALLGNNPRWNWQDGNDVIRKEGSNGRS